MAATADPQTGPRYVLERIALGAPLSEVLRSIVDIIEAARPGHFASILLLDGSRLRLGAAGKLPKAFTDAAEGLSIGEATGSCGTAAFRGERVISRDIATDPLWASHKGLALDHGLRSAWSSPIFDSKRFVIGTFAIYGPEPASPTGADIEQIERMTHLAAIAVERHRIHVELSVSDELIRQSPDAVILTDAQGHIVRWEGRAVAMYGYEEGEVLGRHIDLLHDSRLGGLVFDRIRVRVRADGVFEGQIPCRTKEGVAFTGELRASAIEGAAGKVSGILVLARDVTQRNLAAEERSMRHAERAAREEAERERARFRDALMQAPFHVAILEGSDYLLRFLNDASRAGRLGSQPMNRSVRDYIASTTPEVVKILDDVYETGTPFRVSEFRDMPQGDEGPRYYDFTIQTLTGDHKARSLIIVANDVTSMVESRTRVEELARTLSEERERLGLVTHSTDIGIWICDLPSNVMRGDARALEHVGLGASGPVFAFTEFFAAIHPEDRRQTREAVLAALEGRRDYDVEYRTCWKDDAPRWIRAVGRVFRDPSGVAVRFDGITIDITAQKRAAEELERSYRQLAVNEKLAALGSLVSGVAHEIRTPLTYMTTYLHLVQRRVSRAQQAGEVPQSLAAELTAMLSHSLEGGGRAFRIVNDLRRFVARKKGSRVRKRLDPIVGEALDIFAAVHRGKIAVVRRLGSTRRPHVDRISFQQVVLNLLANAADAMPQGGRVVVETVDTATGVELRVEDGGPGFSDEAKAHLFDPFFTTKPEGMGLGLSIVYRILREHGGNLEVRDSPGGGACVVAFLPVDVSSGSALPQQRQTEAADATHGENDGHAHEW